mmetsp:Transcript_23182/g.77814  ORF Transcript_23182/g.77814 Transcript_23182/m.77814 type:complete len:254 (-) Transcript_23182:1065-1826(-)
MVHRRQQGGVKPGPKPVSAHSCPHPRRKGVRARHSLHAQVGSGERGRSLHFDSSPRPRGQSGEQGRLGPDLVHIINDRSLEEALPRASSAYLVFHHTTPRRGLLACDIRSKERQGAHPRRVAPGLNLGRVELRNSHRTGTRISVGSTQQELLLARVWFRLRGLLSSLCLCPLLGLLLRQRFSFFTAVQWQLGCYFTDLLFTCIVALVGTLFASSGGTLPRPTRAHALLGERTSVLLLCHGCITRDLKRGSVLV